MNALQDRKRDLLLESELNRQVLRVEFQHIQMQINRARANLLQNAWMLAAPAAGFFLARKLTKTSGLFAKGSLLAMTLGRVWEFWQNRRGKPAES